jgi:sugar (pentulose or hexulose) kinase
LHPSFEAALSAMTHPGEAFTPDPKAHQIYDELFNKIYLKIYRQLQPLYDDLSRII